MGDHLRYDRHDVDITRLTVAAAMIASLAIVALIATAWRPPARAAVDPTHTRHPERLDDGGAVAEVHTPLERPTPWLKKVWSALAGFGLAIWIGAAMATIIGVGFAWLVITLSGMLRK